MNIRDLIKAAQEFEPTEKDIQDLRARLNARQKEWEEKERENARNSREFLNRTYTL